MLAKEIIVVDNLSFLVFLQVIEVLGGHLEHLSCSLTVAGCNERCVEIEIAMLMEIGVDGHGHVVTNAHDCTECIGAQTHVGMLAHVFEGLPLLLHGVVVATGSQYLYAHSLHLAGLTGCRALHKPALDR